MPRVTIDRGFDASRRFRIVEADAAAMATLTAAITAQPTGGSSSGRKRPRGVGDAPARSGLWLKADSRSAALCTRDATFPLRRVEFSNSLLLMPPPAAAEASAEAAAEAPAGCIAERVPFQFEAARARGAPDVALAALAADYLTIEELEEDARRRESGEGSDRAAADRGSDAVDARGDDGGGALALRYRNAPGAAAVAPAPTPRQAAARPPGLSWRQLRRLAGCCDAELRAAVLGACAVSHRGRVRLLHPAVVADCLAALLAQVDGHADAGWSLEGVPAAPVAALLAGAFPPVAVEVALRTVQRAPAVAAVAPVAEGLPEVVAVDAAAASRVIGEHVLLQRQRWVPIEAFVQAWRHALPACLLAAAPPSLDALHGRVISDTDSNALVCLPTPLAQGTLPRLKEVFALARRIERDQLRAIVQPTLENASQIDAVIAKHCREIRTAKATLYVLV